MGSSSSETLVRMTSFRSANLLNRFSLLMVLVLVIICSSYLNHSLVLMTNQMKIDEAEFEALKETVEKQAMVIQRFNNSITNTDVLKKVSSLENELKTTELNMDKKMALSQEKVATLLNATLDELNSTVSAAEEQIKYEVSLVKEDVTKYASDTNEKFNMENSFMIYQLAGTFTLIACLISMWHMTAHLRRFKRPFVQRKILAILWMSPIYGITSWLSLVFPKFEIYFGTIKDFYEAYTIYQFLSFLIGVLGRGNRAVVVDKLAKHADHLEPPLRINCCSEDPYDTPKKKADGVLLQCQTFAMQFVFLKPLTSVGIFLCKKFYVDSGQPTYMTPKFWIVMLQNLSVFTAFSGLLKFYHAAQDDFAWCRPFPKFLCIKGIVFMTFWQGLAISILADTTTAGKTKEASETWAAQAQNFLICLEMLLFSIAHFYCFPTEEWQEGYAPVENKDSKFGDNIALRDFFDDLRLIVGRGDENKKKKKKKRKESSKNSDNSPPGTPDTKGESPADSSPVFKSSNSPCIISDKASGNIDEENQNLRKSKRLSVKIIEDALGSLGNDSESNDAVKRLRKSLSESDKLITSTEFNADSNPNGLSNYGSIFEKSLETDPDSGKDEFNINENIVRQQKDLPSNEAGYLGDKDVKPSICDDSDRESSVPFEDEVNSPTETTSLLTPPKNHEEKISSTTKTTSLFGPSVLREEETSSTTEEPILARQQPLHEDQGNISAENETNFHPSVTYEEEAILPIEQSVINGENEFNLETSNLLGQPVISEEEADGQTETNSFLSQPMSGGQNTESTDGLRPSLFTLRNK